MSAGQSELFPSTGFLSACIALLLGHQRVTGSGLGQAGGSSINAA